MFRCQLCACVAPLRTPPRHLVVRRPRHYPARHRANLFVRHRKAHVTDDPGGTGHEAERELLVCPDCARKHRVQ